MKTSRTVSIPLVIFLVVMVMAQPSSQACVNITAVVTGTGYGHYIFVNNRFTYLDPVAQSSGTPATIKSVSEFSGLEDTVAITAGYMESDTDDNIMRLFAGSDVYRVDIAQKKVVERATVATSFREAELSQLTSGVQAAAIYDGKRYFFSGCAVYTKESETAELAKFHDLEDVNLPCQVDTAFTFPSADTPHLMLTKGAKAYGWSLDGPSAAYYMFCAANILNGIPFDLCQCN